MFKKLLTNLPFNPSLIDQLAVYERSLQRELVLRKLGFMLVELAVLVNMAAFVMPTIYPNLNTAHSETQQVLGASTQTLSAGQIEPVTYQSNNLVLGLVIGIVLLAVAGYFYVRNRLLTKEVTIIRRHWGES